VSCQARAHGRFSRDLTCQSKGFKGNPRNWACSTTLLSPNSTVFVPRCCHGTLERRRLKPRQGRNRRILSVGKAALVINRAQSHHLILAQTVSHLSFSRWTENKDEAEKNRENIKTKRLEGRRGNFFYCISFVENIVSHMYNNYHNYIVCIHF